MPGAPKALEQASNDARHVLASMKLTLTYFHHNPVHADALPHYPCHLVMPDTANTMARPCPGKPYFWKFDDL